MVDSYRRPVATRTEIVPGLYLGDAEDGRYFKTHFPDGLMICVHEDPDAAAPMAVHLPILRANQRRPVVDEAALEGVVAQVRKARAAGAPVLIHCHEGRERSPLAMAYVLAKLGIFPSIDLAFQEIKRKRPMVADRRSWLRQN